jgi:hypothetical protein
LRRGDFLIVLLNIKVFSRTFSALIIRVFIFGVEPHRDCLDYDVKTILYYAANTQTHLHNSILPRKNPLLLFAFFFLAALHTIRESDYQATTTITDGRKKYFFALFKYTSTYIYFVMPHNG